MTVLDTRALFRQYYPSGLRTVYVAPAGDDGADGLVPERPKATIQNAIDSAQPGDRVLVASGTWGHTQFYGKNGRSDAWITVEAAPGSSCVIDVSDSPAPWDPLSSTDGLDVQLSSYVGVYGFEIRGSQTSRDTNPSGVAVFRRSHHVAIWGCHIHDFPGGGVNCFYVSDTPWGSQTLPGGGWDAVDVFFNRIHATSRYSPLNTSGISFYGAQDLTGTTIDGTYGYRAVANFVYDVECTVPYAAGGYDFVTDGNGISPDSLAIPNSLNPHLAPYLKRGLIEGNVVAACGGRGVHIYNTKNVDVVNNTLVANLQTASPAIDGSTEVDLQLDDEDRANGVVIANNLLAPTRTRRAFERRAQVVVGNTALGGTDAVLPANQSLRPLGLRVFGATPTVSSLRSATSPAALTPLVRILVPRRPNSLGLQALGLGTTPGGSVVVGALSGL